MPDDDEETPGDDQQFKAGLIKSILKEEQKPYYVFDELQDLDGVIDMIDNDIEMENMSEFEEED